MTEDDSLREEIEEMFAEESHRSRKAARPTRKYPNYSKNRDDWTDFCPDAFGAAHLAELWDITREQEATGVARELRKLRKRKQ